MIQCRKCISTLNTPTEYIRQTKRPLRDRFGDTAESYKTTLTTQYHNTTNRHRNYSIRNSQLQKTLHRKPTKVFALKGLKSYSHME